MVHHVFGWLGLGLAVLLATVQCDPAPAPKESHSREQQLHDAARHPPEPSQAPERTPGQDKGAFDVTQPTPERSTPPPDRQPTPDRRAPAPDRGTPPASWVHPKTPYQGKATYYDADGTGNCSFPKRSPVMVAAMNESQYANADLCGACVKVTGPKGNSIVVTVTDRCPECKAGHLDLSKQAFAMLEDPKKGVISIQWQMVPCASAKPMEYHFKDGSSQWWTAIQIRGHRIPITKVEVNKSGTWVPLARQKYNYFLDAKGFGKDPTQIRIHALNGQTRTDALPAPASDKLVQGTQQF